MDKLPISVIIVARNAERTIEGCLSSIQRNNPAEIIVVDGGSTDSTVDIARRYTERIYSDEGKGLGYARQLGAEQATQEYLAYVDSDVILLAERALATMLAEFQGSEYVSIRAMESPDRKCSSYWDWGQYQIQYYARLRSRQDYLTTMACLIRRETVLRYRFDVTLRYLDDLDIGMRLARDGHKFGTSSVLYRHDHFRYDIGSCMRYEFLCGKVLSTYVRKFGPWHVSLWSPIISLYWLGFFLIKGNFKIMPYLFVNFLVYNAGQVKGFVELMGEALKKPTDLKERWFIALEKEKVWNRKREDIEDRIAERRQTWARLLGLLKGEVIFDRSKRILDIGCEATSIFLALREGKKYAADPLIEYLFHLHPFLEEIEEYKDVNFISSPIEDIALDKSFDIIFFLAALDHIGDLKPVIEKIDSLLVPSGTLIVMVDCYADPLVKKIMSFFDVELYHPHHFVASDITGLFPGYRLAKRRQIFQIYRDCPYGGQRVKLEVYRIDKLLVRMWHLLGEWGKRGDILFTLKFFICYSLALLIASLRRRDRPIHPLKKPSLFVLQKP